ncbi:hypothetical protein [Kitasatospora cineracea]|uniref:Uncharacterized protein n=1 Tax=Kitasatospora cineracea TaxID=88074 RepID=A0A3N4S1M6_9ACTN|nr:hypothetical protein [Kitasatospora cineracea]RPE37119.1 hypothetical protein EDD38_5514 [Kitasatospora cineracea]
MSAPPPRRRGRLRVADRVLAGIAARAARDGSWAVRRARASVRRHRDGVDTTLRLSVDYPSAVPEAAAAAVGAASAALAALAGVPAGRVRAKVTALLTDGAPPRRGPDAPPAPGPGPAVRAPRRRGERRLPAALVALVLGAVCGGWLLLQHCRPERLSQLARIAALVAGRRAGDPASLAAAALLATAGTGLLALSLTGSRPTGWLRSPPGGTPVVVDARLVEREVRRVLDPGDAVTVAARRGVHVSTAGPAGPGGSRSAAEHGLRRAGFAGSTPRLTVRAPRAAAAPNPFPPPRSPEEP